MYVRIGQRNFTQPSRSYTNLKDSNQSKPQLNYKSEAKAFGSGLDFQSFYLAMGISFLVGTVIIGGGITVLNIAIKIDDKKAAKAKKILEEAKANKALEEINRKNILEEAKKMGNLFFIDEYKRNKKQKMPRMHIR